MLYKEYQNARNITWRLLIDLKVNELPVRIADVCKALGIEVRTMEELHPAQHKNNLQGVQVVDGAARFVDGVPVILYNALAPVGRRRFTVAHELGHFVLGHVERMPGHVIETPVLFRKGGAPVSPEETAANVFASRLLAPACVLWGLQATEAEEVARLCRISREAARYRMERMRLLYEREKEFLQTRGHSCFLLSDLEKQVYRQFEGFIRQGGL